MKWIKINNYTITNGNHIVCNKGHDTEYMCGTHVISKCLVGDKWRYTLWEGDKKLGFFDSSQEAMRYINEQ